MLECRLWFTYDVKQKEQSKRFRNAQFRFEM